MTARLAAAGVRLLFDRRVAEVGSSQVRLDDGETVAGRVVLDARGPEPIGPARAGYQKFVGLELALESDGPWEAPLLMDATVPQDDGYRFFYLLPFSARRVLVEETMYSGSPRSTVSRSNAAILRLRTAHGAPRRRASFAGRPACCHCRSTVSSTRRAQRLPIAVGYRGGFFHPVTGYSLPLAARVALAVAEGAHAGTRRWTRGARPRPPARAQRSFGQLLNRLMFEAMPPARAGPPRPLLSTARGDHRALLRLGAAPGAIGRASWSVDRRPGLSWRHLSGSAHASGERMSARPRQRTQRPTGLPALVDEALSPNALGRAAHAEDWPEPASTRLPASPALPRAVWDRALGDVARDILGTPSRQFRARLCELGWRLADGRARARRSLPALVEIVHAGSLIVDDIEDGSRCAAAPPARAPRPRRAARAQRRQLDVLLGDRPRRAACRAARRVATRSARHGAALHHCHLGTGAGSLRVGGADAARARCIARWPPARC